MTLNKYAILAFVASTLHVQAKESDVLAQIAPCAPRSGSWTPSSCCDTLTPIEDSAPGLRAPLRIELSSRSFSPTEIPSAVFEKEGAFEKALLECRSPSSDGSETAPYVEDLTPCVEEVETAAASLNTASSTTMESLNASQHLTCVAYTEDGQTAYKPATPQGNMKPSLPGNEALPSAKKNLRPLPIVCGENNLGHVIHY